MVLKANQARFSSKMPSTQNGQDDGVKEYPILKPIVPQIFGIPNNLCAITQVEKNQIRNAIKSNSPRMIGPPGLAGAYKQQTSQN